MRSDTNNTGSDECQCATDCDVDSFLPSISVSQLTILDGADLDNDVRSRYQQAMEVASRVDENILSDILGKLRRVNSSFRIRSSFEDYFRQGGVLFLAFVRSDQLYTTSGKSTVTRS